MNTTKLPDYLRFPGRTVPSFHDRIGKPPGAALGKPANACGFPVPGAQNPSATSVMAQDYFVRYDSHISVANSIRVSNHEPSIEATLRGKTSWIMDSLTT